MRKVFINVERKLMRGEGGKGKYDRKAGKRWVRQLNRGGREEGDKR